jgi:hypothetical protein
MNRGFIFVGLSRINIELLRNIREALFILSDFEIQTSHLECCEKNQLESTSFGKSSEFICTKIDKSYIGLESLQKIVIVVGRKEVLSKQSSIDYNKKKYESLIHDIRRANLDIEVEVIYLSSVSVYGPSEGKISENYPLKPLSKYAKAKVIGEEIWTNLYNLGLLNKLTIYRLSNVTGIYHAQDNINSLLKKLFYTDTENNLDFSNFKRDYLFINDLANIINLNSQLVKTKFFTMNVSSGVSHNLEEVQQLMIEQGVEIRKLLKSNLQKLDSNFVDNNLFSSIYARDFNVANYLDGTNYRNYYLKFKMHFETCNTIYKT